MLHFQATRSMGLFEDQPNPIADFVCTRLGRQVVGEVLPSVRRRTRVSTPCRPQPRSICASSCERHSDSTQWPFFCDSPERAGRKPRRFVGTTFHAHHEFLWFCTCKPV